jgi:hypothetical protein
MKIEKFPEHVTHIGGEAKALYKHEEAATEHLKKAFAEYVKLVGKEQKRKANYYEEAVPQILGSFVEQWGYVLAREVEES